MSLESEGYVTGPSDGTDLLWRQLKTVPAFRALLRAVESRFYHQYALSRPVLDLGCGDGHFAQMTFGDRLDVGLDPWWGPLQKSRRSGMYGLLAQGMGDRLPFADHSFASAVSNSVLEHIPDVQPVLNEVGRVLQPGGLLLVTMPSHKFTEWLGVAAQLERVGLRGAADAYRRFFNRISRHEHTDGSEVWAGRLAGAGFAIERWQYYFSPAALRALEWGHVQGLPAAISHALTGHWILGPYESSLKHTERWVRPFYEETFPDIGAYLFIAARKLADGPVRVMLPPALPFSRDELAGSASRARPPSPPDLLAVDEAERSAEDREEAAGNALLQPAKVLTPSGPSLARRALPLALVSLALGLAGLGLGALRADPEAPAAGVWLFLLAFLSMAGGAWARRAPGAGLNVRQRVLSLQRRRWLIGPALILSWLGYSSGIAGQAGFALGAWLAGIGLGWYALAWPREEIGIRRRLRHAKREEVAIAVGLLYLALTARYFELMSHPFILNGTEANIGLEALRVAGGSLTNPFGTGWLTSPTLPFFILSLPLQLFGRTTLALRFLSPLIGATTVLALYVLGKQVWGRGVALPAAVLLAGSHGHLHYSRLGMTNIWDPLVVLLAVGGLLFAGKRQRRWLWLSAGVLVGFTGYFYTASHLFPLMLLIAFVLALAGDTTRGRVLGSHALAAGLIALVIALPQVLFYAANPGSFMDRANALGIFQSGWLAREAAATGTTQMALFWAQVRLTLLGFVAVPDASLAYSADAPLLSFVPALFAILGLGVALAQWRRSETRWLLIWLFVTVVFAGILLLSPPASHRLLVAVPAACLLAGVGLTWFGNRVGQTIGVSQRVILVTTTVIALAAAVGDVDYYFGRYREGNRFGDRNSEIAFKVGTYLETLPEGQWTAYFHGAPSIFADFPTIPFLADGFAPGVNLLDVLEPGVPPELTQQGNLTFIMVPERSLELNALQEALPGGVITMVEGATADPLLYIYEWQAENR